MNDLFNNDFTEYLVLLNKYNVEYVLVGGMAVNIHGYRRSTGDMDLFVNRNHENHLRLLNVHREFGMYLGEMELVENFLNAERYDVFTFGVSPIQIDIMTQCKGISFDAAFENSIKYEVDNDLVVPVVGYSQLLVAKRASNRFRDKADIEELEKLKLKRG